MEEAITVCQKTLCSLAVPLKQLVKQEQNPSVVLDVIKKVKRSESPSVTHRALMFSRHFGPAGGNSVIQISHLLQTLKLVLPSITTRADSNNMGR